MSYFDEDFLKFLRQLKRNNNREWFNKNKERFIHSVKEPFENLIFELLVRMGEDDPKLQLTPKETIFKIYRDVRFSKDKSPYKTHVSAVINPGGKKNYKIPGYYLEITGKEVKFYGGAYSPDKNALQKYREEIASNLDKFAKLIKEKKFKKYFGEIRGEKNKRIPKEFNDVLEQQSLIANKQFYFFHSLKPESVLANNFSDRLMELYYIAKPVVLFFRNAVE